MSLSVRTTALACFLVVTLSACGGSSPGNGCDACMSQEAEARCGPASGCDEPSDPVPLEAVNITLRVTNGSSVPKTCYLSAQWFNGTSVVTSAPVNEQVLQPNEMRSGVVSVPSGTTVNLNAICFDPGHSESGWASAQAIRTPIASCVFSAIYRATQTTQAVEYTSSC